MSAPSAIVLAAFHLEDDNLFGEVLRDDFRDDLRAVDVWFPDLDLIASNHEDLVELDFGADIANQFFYPEGITFGDSILFSARLNHRIHRRALNRCVWKVAHSRGSELRRKGEPAAGLRAEASIEFI